MSVYASSSRQSFPPVAAGRRGLLPAVGAAATGVCDLMMLSRGNGRSYTGVVRFEVVFDAQGKAVVRNVGRTKTTVEG